jgi:hypothetical protein
MEPHDTNLETRLREALTTAATPVQGDGVRLDTVHQVVARRRRTRWGARFSLAAAAAAAVVGLVLLTGSDGDRVDTTGGPERTTTPADSRPSSVPDQEPAPPTPSSSTSASVPSSASASTSSTPSTSATTTAPPPLPAFPPQLTPTHGNQAWALYLAVVPPGEYEAPELRAADAAAASAGYGEAGGGELTCDQGAAEALGRDPTSLSAAVYFATEAQAAEARAAFQARGHQVVGIALVTTYCLD